MRVSITDPGMTLVHSSTGHLRSGRYTTGTGLLSAGVGVRRGVAGSLSNWVGVQSARV